MSDPERYEPVRPALRLAARGDATRVSIFTCYRCGWQLASTVQQQRPSGWRYISGLVGDDLRGYVFCEACSDIIRGAATAMPEGERW